MLEKRLAYKDKVNFKIRDVTTWLTIAIDILPNISQTQRQPYNERQPDNEAWSINRI